jgi:L-rhamnose mutarotase
MREYGDLGAGLYSQQFGSWSAAKENVQEEYDLQTNTTQPKNSNTTKNEPSGHKKEETSEGPTKAELLSELHRLDDQLERLIKATDLSEYSIFSQSQYQAEFGSWNKALSAAGIDKEKALLDELERVWKKLGRQPKTTEMNEYGEYSAGMYNRYFGSWNEAIQTLKQTGRLPEQEAVPTRHSAEESDAGKQGEGIAINQLSESICDNLATVNDVSDGSRIEQPILVKIQSVPTFSEYEKSREIKARGITGEEFSLVCWSVHDINVDWQEGHWYLLREALGKAWKSQEVEHRQLSSTRELTATDIGTDPSEDGISKAVKSKEIAETDNQDRSSDSSDLVGSLMDDIDL